VNGNEASQNDRYQKDYPKRGDRGQPVTLDRYDRRYDHRGVHHGDDLCDQFLIHDRLITGPNDGFFDLIPTGLGGPGATPRLSSNTILKFL